jgi:adenylate cyclase
MAEITVTERVERRLAAILACDVAGYSRLMGVDEVGTLRALKTIRREFADPAIASHRGRIVKTTGDGILVEFPSIVDAVACAVAIQDGMVARNAGVAEEKRVVFRIGINIGDIIIEEGDIHGDGVNVAARLEGVAQPGEICVSEDAFRQVRGKLDVAFEDVGEQTLKNIARPVRVYRVVSQTAWTASLPLGTSISGQPERPALALPDKPSLAILPFQNMSGDPAQEYFADGMVEEIITALSRVRAFFVIARNSSFTYKGKSVDVKQVGRELGVHYVLEGSVRKAGNRVRITCQLIEAATNHHVWGDRFEGNLKDVFDLQDRVTESVVGAIEPSLQRAEIERASVKPTENLAAYDLYLRSLPYLNATTKSGSAACLKLLHRAISIEPTYSLAKATAAWCYSHRCAQLWATDDERTEGIRLAREALDSHRDDPMTLSLAGVSLAYLARDFEAGRHCVDRSLVLNPSSASNFARKGYLEMWLGNLAAAEEALRRAIRLSPLDLEMGVMLFALSNIYARAGRFEEGLSTGLSAIREMPTHIQTYSVVISCLVRLDRIDEAREVAAKILKVSPGFTIAEYTRTIASRDPGTAGRKLIDALRLVGLPE